jgi:2-oxoglutarate dehydrogenase E1 component
VATESPESRIAGFGPNEWLVDEIYEQFLADRSQVDPAWWEFFEGYTPPDFSSTARSAPATPVVPPAPATHAQPAP